MVDIELSKYDFFTIISVSRDVAFLEAMIELREKDIIEYLLKSKRFILGWIPYVR